MTDVVSISKKEQLVCTLENRHEPVGKRDDNGAANSIDVGIDENNREEPTEDNTRRRK